MTRITKLGACPTPTTGAEMSEKTQAVGAPPDAPVGPERDCPHGQLARSCDRCADAAEIAELRAEVSALRGTPEETRAALDRKDAEITRLRAALQRIARWHGEFPATGKFWDEEKTRPTSYAAEYGASGERDFMRQVALDALGPNE